MIPYCFKGIKLEGAADAREARIWRARLLGGFEFVREGKEIGKLRSRSSLALLAYLTLHTGKEFPKDDLGALFWPDSDGDRQDQNLRRSLSDLRQHLEDDSEEGLILVSRRDFVMLDEVRVQADVHDFRLALASGAVEKALDLYRGPLLPTSSAYFLRAPRMELEADFARAAVGRCKALLATDPHAAIDLALDAIGKAPMREDLYAVCMDAYAAAGMVAEAIRQYEVLERLLDEELGETPSQVAVDALERLPRARPPKKPEVPFDVVLLTSEETQDAARAIGDALAAARRSVSVERHDSAGARAEKTIRRIREARAVVVLVGPSDRERESTAALCDVAIESSATFVPVLVGTSKNPSLVSDLLANHDPLGGSDVAAIVRRVLDPAPAPGEPPSLEPSAGGMPLDSKFYVERGVDALARQSLGRRDGVLLINGPRQIGKTSLLARLLAGARERGVRTAQCDLQTVGAGTLARQDTLYRSIAYRLARDLGVECDWQTAWTDWLGPNDNLEQAVESILAETDGAVVWAFDESDRLFSQPYCDDFFGLLRGWYNQRVLDSAGPWKRLDIVITYASEVHLFIKDVNQSPFNVGTRVSLKDFTLPEIAELNRRYGSPLRTDEDVEHLYALCCGHPYLSRKALDWVVTTGGTIWQLDAVATEEEGPFGDHLRRLLIVLSQLPAVAKEALSLAMGHAVTDPGAIDRLRWAGIVQAAESNGLRFRTPLYRDYLASRLRIEPA